MRRTAKAVTIVRIDDVRKVPYNQPSDNNRPTAPAGKTKSTSAAEPAPDGMQRADRIDALKQMFSTGQPIDVNKLADKLVESGIFSNGNG